MWRPGKSDEEIAVHTQTTSQPSPENTDVSQKKSRCTGKDVGPRLHRRPPTRQLANSIEQGFGAGRGYKVSADVSRTNKHTKNPPYLGLCVTHIVVDGNAQQLEQTKFEISWLSARRKRFDKYIGHVYYKW
jgi:hypothetical protein